jgi:hypothetical protein
VTALVALPAMAQEISTTDMQILLDKLKADKKLLVAENMQLSEAEAKAFWPIYEAYQGELVKLNKRTGDLIASYAKDYNANTLTDEGAGKLTEEYLAIQQAEVDLARNYAQKLGAVLPKKKVARYLQIESKIRSLIKMDLAEGIPLVE